jgi:hypothetical protein
MRNVSRVNFLRKIPNQTLKAMYYPPKTEREIEAMTPTTNGFLDLSLDELKTKYEADFIKEHKMDFADLKGKLFRYKDGTEDVYTKSGYEHEVFEYLDRQSVNKRRYRIITDVTHIDFVAGGRVRIDNQFYYIAKVINMTNDIPTQNRSRGKNIQSPHFYAPKIIALI